MTKRRTKGDGGLTQRHDHPTCPAPVDGTRPEHRCRGRWQGTIDVWIAGKKKRKYIYGATQAEVRRKLTVALREKETGTLVVESMTVAAWLDYWLDNIAARTLRPQTLAGYRSKVETYIKPAIGKQRLSALRPEHIRAMHDAMRAEGKAEATLRQTHAILKRALKIAVQEGKLGVNPADRMESPTTETAEREQFTVDQARQVLAAADDNPRWWLAVLYGMRQGEVLGLTWRHVDLDAGLLRVEQSLQKIDGETWGFGRPKSKASRRTIPLHPAVVARLRLHRIAASEHPGGADPDALVFPARPDQPTAPRMPWTDYRDWRALLGLADAPQIALHAARNSAASLMEAAGVSDRLVAQILGHAQVSMTHGYQSADLGRMRGALDEAWGLVALPSKD